MSFSMSVLPDQMYNYNTSTTVNKLRLVLCILLLLEKKLIVSLFDLVTFTSPLVPFEETFATFLVNEPTQHQWNNMYINMHVYSTYSGWSPGLHWQKPALASPCPTSHSWKSFQSCKCIKQFVITRLKMSSFIIWCDNKWTPFHSIWIIRNFPSMCWYTNSYEYIINTQISTWLATFRARQKSKMQLCKMWRRFDEPLCRKDCGTMCVYVCTVCVCQKLIKNSHEFARLL